MKKDSFEKKSFKFLRRKEQGRIIVVKQLSENNLNFEKSACTDILEWLNFENIIKNNRMPKFSRLETPSIEKQCKIKGKCPRELYFQIDADLSAQCLALLGALCTKTALSRV